LLSACGCGAMLSHARAHSPGQECAGLSPSIFSRHSPSPFSTQRRSRLLREAFANIPVVWVPPAPSAVSTPARRPLVFTAHLLPSPAPTPAWHAADSQLACWRRRGKDQADILPGRHVLGHSTRLASPARPRATPGNARQQQKRKLSVLRVQGTRLQQTEVARARRLVCRAPDGSDGPGLSPRSPLSAQAWERGRSRGAGRAAGPALCPPRPQAWTPALSRSRGLSGPPLMRGTTCQMFLRPPLSPTSP
jgi:hypothetical protein